MTKSYLRKIVDYLLPPISVAESNAVHNDVTFAALSRSLLRNRRFVTASTVLFSLVAVVLTLLMPKTYVLSMRVTPALNSSTMMDSGRGSLSSLLGGGTNGEGVLFNNFVDLLHSNRVAAALNNNQRVRSIIYRAACCGNSPFFFAPLIAKAKASLGFPTVLQPSVPKTFDFLKTHIKILQEDAGTSILSGATRRVVTVSVQYNEPEAAKDILEATVHSADDILRVSDREDADQKISYLMAQLKTEARIEPREALLSLLTAQEKQQMMVEVPKYYSFFELDSPAINPVPNSPKLAVNLPIGFGLGFVFGMLFALFRDGKNGLLC